MRTWRRSILAAFSLLAVSPLFAYTIYLKDGSTVQAKDKYTLDGDRAVITLPNGTQTFLPAKKIDVARTEQANQNDYGSAVVIDDSHQAPPPSAVTAPKKTISDLIHTKPPEPRPLPPARREARPGSTPPVANASPGSLLKTRAGFLDLATLARRPFAQGDVAGELQQFFRSQGIEEVEIYQGTQSERPMVEVTTNSEGGVFKALAVGANALLRTRDKHPRISGFELLLMTPGKERAGQFVLTPELATELASRHIEVSAFYLNNVQF